MSTNQTSTMSETTIDRLVTQLCEEIENHPYKDEVVSLAIEQLMDD